MTVCRYFLKGYCRKGDSCRFEHTYYSQRPPLLNTPAYNTGYSQNYGPRGGSGGSGVEWRNQENQHPHFNHQQQQETPQQSQTEQIMADINIMLSGKQYLFSCVPGRPAGSNCKSLTDLSPEEIRVKFLEYQAANNIPQFLSEMFAHKESVETLLRQLLRFPAMLEDVQPPLARSVVQPAPISGSSFAFSSTATSPAYPAFGANPAPFAPTFDAQQPAPPTFGNVPAVGQNQVASTPAMNVTQNTEQPKMLFGKPVLGSGGLFDRNRLSQPAFGVAPQIAPAGFPTSPTPQVMQPMTSQPGMTMNLASQIAQPMPSQPAPAQFAVSTPAVSTPYQTSNADEVYTPLMDMSPEDLAAFQERSFTIANVPLVPPAREHCF